MLHRPSRPHDGLGRGRPLADIRGTGDLREIGAATGACSSRRRTPRWARGWCPMSESADIPLLRTFFVRRTSRRTRRTLGSRSSAAISGKRSPRTRRCGRKNLEILGSDVGRPVLASGLVDEILVYVMPVLLATASASLPGAPRTTWKRSAARGRETSRFGSTSEPRPALIAGSR